MASAVLQNGLAALNFSRTVTLGLVEEIPDDKMCYQPIPHANHPLWVLGHMVCTDEFFMNKVGGKPFNKFEAWEGRFFMKSKPTGKLADYPSVAEVKEALHANREKLIAWFSSMSDAKLAEALPGDLAQFSPSHGALMSTMAWHEGLHAGQITVVRKSLGMAPKFG